MNCIDVRNLLAAHVDGELDLVRSMEIDKHIEQCDDCSVACARQLALGAALRDTAQQTAPLELRHRIVTAIRKEAGGAAYPRWLGLAAALLVGMGLTWLMLPHQPASVAMADEIVANHVRSMQADHLTDVETSDRHTVKPWFNGKLDFSPRVQDLAGDGFPLVGGRLDYLDHRPVAALVYRRDKHLINLFAWPAESSDPVPSTDVRGFHIIHWIQDGLVWCAVSDVESAQLNRFSALLQSRPPATQP
jgi:anti-sigma factor RsiW